MSLMFEGKKIAVVIPAHNEEKFISGVIKDVPEFVDLIIVVDDASTDGTSRQAASVGDPRVVLLRNEKNLGVGGATKRGYVKAMEMGADIVVKVDGDGQMPLDRLSKLLEAIIKEGYDYAKGNRFLEGGSLKKMPFVRLVGNIILTFLTKLASGYWHIFDPQNGFTAITSRVLKTLPLERIHNGYFFENDMLVNLNIFRYRVKDVPIPTIYGEEESGIKISSIMLTFPWLLLKRFLYRVYQKYVLRDFSPIALFLFLGFLLLAWGFFFGIYHWIKSVRTGIPASTGTVMLSVLPLILGFQLVLEALVLDIQESPR